MRDEETILTV